MSVFVIFFLINVSVFVMTFLESDNGKRSM